MINAAGTILFDLDGTIADTNTLIQRTLIETLDHHTDRVWAADDLLPYWGMRLREQMLIFAPAIDLEAAVAFYRQRYRELQPQLLAEFPGIRPMLEKMREAGLRLGIITSKKRLNAQETLQGLDYCHFFELLIAEEDTARHKPAPDPLLLALEKLKITAKTAVYVGDNPDDIRAAHAAGMPAIAVGWCIRPREELLATQPDYLIESPDELLSLLMAATV